jgi:hypothetical protein
LKITLNNFSGIQPKLSAHLLNDEQGQLAQNARIEKADLRAWQDTSLITTITTAAYKTLHQYKEGANENWVYSTADLDFAQSPIAADTYERLYYSGGTAPIEAFANDLDSSPWDQAVDFYKVGHAKPTTGWGFVSGHTGGSEFRSYVYTYVSRFGEESGPSAVLNTEVYDGVSNVILEDFVSPSAGYGNLSTVGSSIPYVRIYRTNASTTGAEYQYVGQFNATTHTFGTDTFTDDVADADLGEVLSTEFTEAPPTGLTGLIGLSNGIFAGFVGNELYLSDLYLPHSWPDEYVLSFDYDIVGLGYLGTNIIVLTEGIPYMVTGFTPDTMQKQRLNGFYPCRSKMSIVNSPFGVLFTSHEGLILIDHNGPRNVTFDYVTPSDWEDFEPETMRGTFYNGKYFGFYSSTNEGTFVLDVQNNILSTVAKYYQAAYQEVAEGIMYVIRAEDTTMIRQWEGNYYNYLYYQWKSKKFLLPQDMGFTCAQVIVDAEERDAVEDAIGDDGVLEAANAVVWATGDLQDSFNYGSGPTETELDMAFNTEEFNGSALFSTRSLSFSTYIQFQLYIDNVLVFTKNIDNDRVFRLPPLRGRRVEVKLSGYIPIRRVSLAQSPQEIGS